MRNFFRILKKNWITVWLVVAVVGVCTFVVYASYTGIYSVKRVVSTTASEGVPFSSNSMQSYTGAIPSRHITTAQSSGNYTYNLTVCDFDQADPLTRYVSENGITYNLTAQLCVKINGEYYTLGDSHVSQDIRTDAGSRAFAIKYVSDGGSDVSSENTSQLLGSGNQVTFSSHRIRPKVTGSEMPNGTNKYAIVFDGYELTEFQTIDYYVKLMATPTNGDPSLDAIACYLYLTKSTNTDSSWKGRLQETSNTENYDAYNYIIEGSGSGQVTVRWNSSYVAVSEVFIAQNGLPIQVSPADANGNVWNQFVLDVDDTTTRIEIQLFKNNPSGDYSNVLSYIGCSYTAY